MEIENQARIQSTINAILSDDLLPIKKVQHIVSLGFDEEEANILVERYQSGQAQQIFYEELPHAQYDNSTTEKTFIP